MDERIKRVMSQILGVPVEQVNENSSPENLENWDSLRHMNLVLALEEEFDVEFAEGQIGELLSFHEIHAALGALLSQS